MAKDITITLESREIGSITISNRQIDTVTLVDVVGVNINNRVTEDGIDTRITEEGDTRITE